MFNNITNKILAWFSKWNKINKELYTDLHKKELAHLVSIFNLLVNGHLTGLPAAPSHISLELLEYTNEEIIIMFNENDISLDPLSELFSVFDID